jgi:uncharacterized protein (UPF0333 family)
MTDSYYPFITYYMLFNRLGCKGLSSMNPPHIRQQLSKMIKSRMALSAVVTTLIILVIAVLLAGAVSYFAINVTSTRVQQESLALQRQHVWYDVATESAQAAIMVINTGGRDAVVAKITVRGQQPLSWHSVFYTTTTDSIPKDLPYCDNLANNAQITVGGKQYTLHEASNVVTVKTGETLILYISNPDSISSADVGLTVSINLFTSEAMYYKEANVQ